MSNEVAVPEPLSGTEVIEAIVEKVRRMLARDCFLSPVAAYEHFSGKIHIEITAIDCGREAKVETEVAVNLGRSLEESQEGAYDVESEEVIEPEAPNVVRRETGQSVPVVTTDSGGKSEVKRVKYQRKSTVEPRGGTKLAHTGKNTPPAA